MKENFKIGKGNGKGKEYYNNRRLKFEGNIWIEKETEKGKNILLVNIMKKK